MVYTHTLYTYSAFLNSFLIICRCLPVLDIVDLKFCFLSLHLKCHYIFISCSFFPIVLSRSFSRFFRESLFPLTQYFLNVLLSSSLKKKYPSSFCHSYPRLFAYCNNRFLLLFRPLGPLPASFPRYPSLFLFPSFLHSLLLLQARGHASEASAHG
ncbi:hypothetical protein AAFF_G00296080, partial [Aldrovandia affinis]